MKVKYYLVFANRSDRMIQIPRRIAIAASHVLKSPEYIEIIAEPFSNGWCAIIENGVARSAFPGDGIDTIVQGDIDSTE